MLNDNASKVSIIAYFISKYDKTAVMDLGYRNYSDAFNGIAPLFQKSSSFMKMRRDEFDALVSDTRKGWKNRKPARGVLQMHEDLKNCTYSELFETCKKLLNGALDESRITTEEKELDTCSPQKTASDSQETSNVKKRPETDEYCKAISSTLGTVFAQGDHNLWISEDKEQCFFLLFSKNYPKANGISEYWYSVHPRQLAQLFGYKASYFAFCFNDSRTAIIIENKVLLSFLGALNTTTTDKETYWHIKIRTDKDSYWIQVPHGKVPLDKNAAVIIKLAEKEVHEQNEAHRKKITIKSKEVHEIKVSKMK